KHLPVHGPASKRRQQLFLLSLCELLPTAVGKLLDTAYREVNICAHSESRQKVFIHLRVDVVITVHEADEVASRQSNALVADCAGTQRLRVGKYLEAWVPFRVLAQDIHGGIRRTVIDADDFKVGYRLRCK